MIVNEFTDILNADISASEDPENGRIGIHLIGSQAKTRVDAGPTTPSTDPGTIIIKRVSSKDNFTILEDMKTITVEDIYTMNYTWYDYTVESGIFYGYTAQLINDEGNCGPEKRIAKPIMMIFNSAFLTTATNQLKMQFDANVSSLKKMVSDATVTTIGSKYPFVKRNGNIGYFQFPITGMITYLQDDDGTFMSKEEIFGKSIDLYNNFNLNHSINKMADFVYEREFRRYVNDFLTDGKVKLFRSTTEGNFLVKITDVSLTPNTTLGRRIYSFSATASEIDECNIENYEKYSIISREDTRLDTIVKKTDNTIQDSLARD